MAGPNCVIVSLGVVRQGRPPLFLVVCSCGWSRRVFGSEDRARQSHNAHRNDAPINPEDAGPIRSALESLRAAGLDWSTIREEWSGETDSSSVEETT